MPQRAKTTTRKNNSQGWVPEMGFLSMGVFMLVCIGIASLLDRLVWNDYGATYQVYVATRDFVLGTYAGACVVVYLLLAVGPGDAFARSIQHFGFWRRTFAEAVAAGIAALVTSFLVILVGNVVEFGRFVFFPTVPFNDAGNGWLIVIFTALAAYPIRRWLTARLLRPRKIFINYRRDDSAANAARIGDRLAQAMGRKRIFMDIDNLSAGQRFDRELENALAECTVFIAVIGKRWLDFLRQRAQSGERDYVREEIAGALKRGLFVVPVLTDGALLPQADQLPPEVRDLVLHQKHILTHEYFGRDMDHLIQAIRKT